MMTMFQRELYFARVVDDDDQNHSDGEKKSRIKVKPLPHFKDVEDDLLPWAMPYEQDGFSASHFRHNPPHVDDHVWVFFLDEYFKECYYIGGRYVQGLFDWTKWEDAEGMIQNDDVAAATYPNPRMWLLPDNTVLFWNSETSEKGIINQNGTYTVLNGDGDIFTYFKDRNLKVYNDEMDLQVADNGDITFTTGNVVVTLAHDGDIELEANGSKITISNAGNVEIDAGANTVKTTATMTEVGGNSSPITKFTELDTAITALLTALSLHTHIDPISGSTGPPTPGMLPTSTSGVPPAGIPLNLASAQKSKTA